MSSYTEQHSEERVSFHVPKTEGFDEVVLLNDRRRRALEEIDKASFSGFHVKICLVAGVGFFTDAYDVFAISIAVTMLGFVYGHDKDPFDGLPTLSGWESAGLKLATAAGNLIGQLLFGWLADILGRKRMYGLELAIMIVATFAQAVSGAGPGLNIVGILIFWRIILGIGVGGDYPLSAVIASEFASTRRRGRMMTAVFASQGWGQLAASLVGFVVVVAFKDAMQGSTSLGVDHAWRLLIGFGCIPGIIALYSRLTVPETPRFTMDIDRMVGRATRDIRNLGTNGYGVYLDEDDDENHELRVTVPRASRDDFIAHFSKWDNFKVLFGTAYSWFALDIAFYTLSLDNNTILTSVGFGGIPGDVYTSLFNICVGNIIATSAGYVPGFAASFFLIDRVGRKPIQLMGFSMLTVLFWIMGFGSISGTPLMVLYCLANFFQNFGPNTTTFIIPGEVFPTRYRCTSYGISAAFGKLGAVIAQILYAAISGDEYPNRVRTLWMAFSFVMLTGVFSTLLIPETNQRTLEELSNEDQDMYITGSGRGRPSPVANESPA
ncbi:major facilitator superfamily domain-containing protein [Chiua virens]|nr:major facilitator superfamily domain-containing protein [Chiua virens]